LFVEINAKKIHESMTKQSFGDLQRLWH